MSIIHRDRVAGCIIAINPSATEWRANFADGAAAILLADGTLIVADGPTLDHASILAMAGFDADTEDGTSLRLQLHSDSAEIELWDDLDSLFDEVDIADQDVTPEILAPYTKHTAAARVESAIKTWEATSHLTGGAVTVTLRSSACFGPRGDGIWQQECFVPETKRLTLVDSVEPDFVGHRPIASKGMEP